MAIRAGFKTLIITAGVAFGCAACSSAPIDMRAADPLEREALAQQGELRTAAADLSNLVETKGWAVSDNASDAARAMLQRLIGGQGDGEAARASTVAAYLDAHDDPAAAAQADLGGLADNALRVAQLAIVVASADGSLPQAGLARDIAASESALGAVRRAEAFFKAVRSEADLNEAQAGQISASLTTLREAENALARGADALAERRWAARNGLLG